MMSSEGRSLIGRQVKELRDRWDAVYGRLTNEQRRLDVAIVDWTSYSESLKQSDDWLREVEGQLGSDCPMRASLEEKKDLLSTFKVSTTLTCSISV